MPGRGSCERHTARPGPKVARPTGTPTGCRGNKYRGVTSHLR
jgi:hypothetical protein